VWRVFNTFLPRRDSESCSTVSPRWCNYCCSISDAFICISEPNDVQILACLDHVLADWHAARWTIRGCCKRVNEFEVVAGKKSSTLFVLQGSFLSSENFPMLLLFEPFGYTTSPTVVQIICYFFWAFLGCTYLAFFEISCEPKIQ
jgi:hypothetical protein